MKQHQRTVGLNDEWLTPSEIIKALGPFDLDPCAPVNRPWDTAKVHYTVKDDGLSKPWHGRVWCNPPFNRYEKWRWMKKMAEHNCGCMLVPFSAETQEFKQYVWGRCSGVLALDVRPRFHYVNGKGAKGNSGCTICIVAYGHYNFLRLRDSGLGVMLQEAA